MTRSPLAPAAFPTLPRGAGVQLASLAAGLRYQRRADLMLAVVPEGTTVAGTLTQSLCPSAPVDWCRTLLPRGTGRALVCNAGNANAFTGKAGETAAAATASTIARSLGVEEADVFLASTGVIGETLPEAALTAALPTLVDACGPSGPAAWEAAAGAIRTTDTFAKGATSPIVDTDAVVVGIAKGSGMIAPDMATMLAFVFTDLAVPAPALQAATSRAVELSLIHISEPTRPTT